VGRGRSEATDFSLAVLPEGRGLLVWDSVERGSAKARIEGLVFDSATMKERGPAKTISNRSLDAEAPLVLPGARFFWLLFVSFDPLVPSGSGRGAGDESGLVESPPQHLVLSQVDGAGVPQGDPISMSVGPSSSLVFDAIPTAGGKLLVAYRQTPIDRLPGAVPIQLAVVSESGAIERGQVQTEETLGPGVPLLLGTGDGVWLSVGGPSGRTLLGRVEGARATLLEEPSLFGRIPLAASEEQLLVARPRALDLDLELFRCQL
jgi:hypothetical protein